MTISRVVIFGMGTLLFCLLLIKVAEADYESEFAPIHAVKHDGSHCDGSHPDNGEQCREGDDGDVDDDVDDTFKVVNKMGVSFSPSSTTGQATVSVNSFDGIDSEELNNHELVLGH